MCGSIRSFILCLDSVGRWQADSVVARGSRAMALFECLPTKYCCEVERRFPFKQKLPLRLNLSLSRSWSLNRFRFVLFIFLLWMVHNFCCVVLVYWHIFHKQGYCVWLRLGMHMVIPRSPKKVGSELYLLCCRRTRAGSRDKIIDRMCSLWNENNSLIHCIKVCQSRTLIIIHRWCAEPDSFCPLG